MTLTHDEREHVLLAHFAHRTDAEHAQHALHATRGLHVEIVESQIAPEHPPSAESAPADWAGRWTLGALAIGALGALLAGASAYLAAGSVGVLGAALVAALAAALVVTAVALGALVRSTQRRERDSFDLDESLLRIELRGDDREVRWALRAHGADAIRDLAA